MERIDVAQMLIADLAGRVLLVREDRGATGFPWDWGLPGGGRQPGETLAEAAVRETREETGLVVEAGPLLVVSELIWRTHDVFFVFRGTIVSDAAPEPVADDDVIEVRWVAAAEADRLLPWYPQGVTGLLAGAEPRYYVDSTTGAE